MSESPKAPHTFTEAPASWNIKFRLNGFDEQITLRGESYAEIVPTIDKARSYVNGLHSAPTTKATHDAINVEPPAPQATATTPAPLIPGVTGATFPQPPAQNGALTFEVERIEATIDAGKVSFRCKGEHFTKFGVICWPEVIKAAGLNLDPAKGSYTYNPPLIAEYVTKEDGKPQKVTRLYQKAA